MVVGLTFCEYVIVHEARRNVSLIGLFKGLPVSSFPSDPQRFYVCATLSGGAGHGIIRVVGTRLATDEQVYAKETAVFFPDRLRTVYVLHEVGGCVFPEAGPYLFTLLLDGEWLADRRVIVY
jgi:hypothetical protein